MVMEEEGSNIRNKKVSGTGSAKRGEGRERGEEGRYVG
jgi:hypothetical protein